jgi:hypothetical protein
MSIYYHCCSSFSRVCTPGHFDGARKVSAKLLGPEIHLTLQTGKCTIAVNHASGTKELKCTTPAITYDKKPIQFVGKHTT